MWRLYVGKVSVFSVLIRKYLLVCVNPTSSSKALENEHERVHLDEKRVFGTWDTSFEGPVLNPLELASLDEGVKLFLVSVLVAILVVHFAHAGDEVTANFAHGMHIVEATRRNVSVHENARTHDDVKFVKVVAGQLVDPSTKPNLATLSVGSSRHPHLVKLGGSICTLDVVESLGLEKLA